jgi:DNA repair protein RecO (recombination protein O)
MAILRDSAIILYSIKHGDSSLILHVLGRENGRLTIIGKGARSKRPRFGAALEVMTLSEMVFSHRPTRDIQVLREARIIDSFPTIRNDLERIALGMAVCELLRMVTPVQEASSDIFDIAVKALDAINRGKKNIRNHFWRFELELFRPLGIGLSLSHCLSCGRELKSLEGKQVEFDPSSGAVKCPTCQNGSGMALSLETFRVLQYLNRTKVQTVETLKISPKSEKEIIHLLSRHLRTHLPIRRDLKSLDALTWSR